MLKNFVKQNWRVTLIAFLGVVFFFVYLYLYLPQPPLYPNYLVFNQPDESINYFFIRELAINNQYHFPQTLSQISLNQVHPRSTTVINGALTPIGFPGIVVIFGFILNFLVKIFGELNFNILAVSLTPFLAAITPLFFYFFLKRVFDHKIALISAILLFILPAWWYYASRPFQHNTLLIFLTIVALSCYVRSWEKKNLWQKISLTFFTGLFFGLAVYVRPSEVVWLSLVGVVGLIWARQRWCYSQYFGLLVGLILTAILFFYTQIAVYGYILGSGYVKPEITGLAGSILSGPQGINIFKAIFLPFGFHPVVVARNIVFYFFNLFGVWSALTVFAMGLLVLGWRHNLFLISTNLQTKTKILKYLFILFFISLSLLIFYGSWYFFDNLVLHASIGTSYVRYFLPIYVFSVPLVAWLLLWFWQKKLIGRLVAAAFFIFLFGSSVYEVGFRLEGLVSVKQTVNNYYAWQQKIVDMVPSKDIVLTHYGDKYIFPLRQVIVGWESVEQLQAISNLVKEGYGVWLYDLALDQNQEKELSDRLISVGVNLSPVLANWDNLELRKIILVHPALPF